MKIFKFNNLFEVAISRDDYEPLNAPERIDFQSLIYDVLNLHFQGDSVQAEESDIPIRLEDYAFYDLKLLKLDQIRDIDSVESAPVYIDEDKIKDIMDQILRLKTYPPIVVDIMGHIIDGYHRVFALKGIGCDEVWAYIPDRSTYNDPSEDFDEDFDED